MQCFGPVIVSPVHLGAFSNSGGEAVDSTLIAVLPSPGVKVTVAESLSRDPIKVSEWCDLWEMKLNACIKTMIPPRLSTMHPQSPALIIGGTVLKESDDLAVL